jgi:hypothetical protein
MTDRDDIAIRMRAAAASVHAPASLRAAVAAGPQRAARRGPAPRLVALGGAGLACVVAVALAIAPGGHDPVAPTVASAASSALRAPTRPAPRGADGVLTVSAAGVRFPDYGAGSRWRPAGTRTDRLGDRTTVSVAYDAAGVRAGYAIVGGAPLPVPAGARRMVYEGVPVAVIERDGLRIVTWRRGGHTCVVAARGVGLDRLLGLVAQT